MELIYTSGNKPLSLLIKYFTKESWVKSGRVSHVAIRYGGDEATWMVEASIHGFAPNWWDYFKNNKVVYKKFQVLALEESELEKLLDEQVNKMIWKKYDYCSIFGFIIAVIWYKITGKKSRNLFGKSSAFGCSEAAYHIFKKIQEKTGIEYFKDQDPHTVFPEELLIQCEMNPVHFKDTTRVQ